MIEVFFSNWPIESDMVIIWASLLFAQGILAVQLWLVVNHMIIIMCFRSYLHNMSLTHMHIEQLTVIVEKGRRKREQPNERETKRVRKRMNDRRRDTTRKRMPIKRYGTFTDQFLTMSEIVIVIDEQWHPWSRTITHSTMSRSRRSSIWHCLMLIAYKTKKRSFVQTMNG